MRQVLQVEVPAGRPRMLGMDVQIGVKAHLGPVSPRPRLSHTNDRRADSGADPGMIGRRTGAANATGYSAVTGRKRAKDSSTVRRRMSR
jgi:hypothetical protein